MNSTTQISYNQLQDYLFAVIILTGILLTIFALCTAAICKSQRENNKTKNENPPLVYGTLIEEEQ